ncbi:response regulator transcription factor [Spiractinospora alimapuensis]|uniref:response regulator transcription factor n=1 Tax=Spiractinospora alimapuensis TaxID=2820884 RepID=UPI001F1CEAAD|nr:response regulator transcription factor [Spiractinospora alimapuensis]QVQ54924.1 response regulator transcription factor [Spiractinospora alimapuensis]
MRVVIAEDSALLREGLVRLLAEEGHEVVASVGDAPSLLKAVRESAPDVAVVDVRMPPSHTSEGLQAAVQLRRELPDMGVLVLSQYVEREYATQLYMENSEGVGYLLKDRVGQVGEFLDALERVAAGGAAFDPQVVRHLIAGGQRRDPLESLTPRERDIIELMAQGHTNAAISARLHISQSAVEKHVNAIFDKLHLGDTAGYSRRILTVLHYIGA